MRVEPSTLRISQPLSFTIGDGAPRVNVKVTITNQSGTTVHTGHIARVPDRTTYVWVPPPDAGAGPYSVNWQGTKAETGQYADLVF